MAEKFLFVGIDTSNYTTSVAVADYEGEIIANLKIPLQVSDGERGLRQSEALFSHIKNLPVISKKLREVINESGGIPVGVGYSAYPRDVQNSYMPCFLAGEAVAHTAAAISGAEIYKFSHQAGHIMAAVYSSIKSDLLQSEFAAFHVSGGTTEILKITPCNEGDIFKKITLIGKTHDLNAGQAIDRTGVMLGLKFPCGVEMEKLAVENLLKIPNPKVSVDGLCCNLSGLENLAEKLYKDTQNKSLVSAYVFEFIADTLCKMTDNLLSEYPKINLIYAGGVMSNSIIKEKLSRKYNCYFASPEFSTDNAAGIALLCCKKYMQKSSYKPKL